jgi:hypothetical protein
VLEVSRVLEHLLGIVQHINSQVIEYDWYAVDQQEIHLGIVEDRDILVIS